MKYCPICTKNYEDEAQVCDLDGATLRIAGKQDPYLGKYIKGRYQVLRKLGEGGMGTVYLAEQISVGRKVALKLLQGNYANDDEFIGRFRREARLAASLNHHNIVTVYDFDQTDDGSLFIAMEYVDGQKLSDLIRREAPFEIDRATGLGIQIADGLEAAHRAGVIHRDIKPDNIMVVGEEGAEEIKLMDFGIARLRDTGTMQITRSGSIMGTPAYMAPEQAEGVDVSEQTDIYALGIVLYEMLSGGVPFTAGTPGAVIIKQIKETPVALRKLRREVPAKVERTIMQALEKQPDKRQNDMAEVVQQLRSAATNLATDTTPKSTPVGRAWNVVGRVFHGKTEEAKTAGRKTGAAKQTGRKTRDSARQNVPTPVPDPSPAPANAEPLAETQVIPGTIISDPSTIVTDPRTIAATQVLSPTEAYPTQSRAPRVNKRTAVSLAAAGLLLIAGLVFYNMTQGDRALPPEIESLMINSAKTTIAQGENAQLTVNAKYSDGKMERLESGLEWQSSNTSVARVNSDGQIEGRGNGVAEITVRHGEKTSLPSTFIVKAEKPPAPPPPIAAPPTLVSLTLIAPKHELKPTETIGLLLKGKYSDGKEFDIRDKVQWHSSDKRIASVDTKGRVTAVNGGEVQITARHEDLTSSAISLNVKDIKPVAVPTPEPPKPPSPSVRKDGGDMAEQVRDGIRNARNLYEDGKYSEAIAAADRVLRMDAANNEARSLKIKAERARKADR